MTKRRHFKRRLTQRASKTGESYIAALRNFGSRAKETPMETNAPNAITSGYSFCNKNDERVNKLIPDPRVYICDECIDVGTTILHDEAKRVNAA